MSKIMIKSKVFGKNSDEVLINTCGIKKDNKIIYKFEDTYINIILTKNSVLIKRDSPEIKSDLEFELFHSHISNYIIKNLNLKMKVETKTLSLIKTNNSIKINYELFINNEYSDTFEYKIEWSDL